MEDVAIGRTTTKIFFKDCRYMDLTDTREEKMSSKTSQLREKRIEKDTENSRRGKKWKIFPTYAFFNLLTTFLFIIYAYV